ncbi:IS3 family transposase [Sphingobacterium bovistauri]|nr:IS3 family transposase [Sphingobacterium bovistauri]
MQAIEELRQDFSLDLLLDCGKMARSSYYYHQQGDKLDKYTDVKRVITEVFNQHKGRYGYRRIKDELQKKEIFLNHKTVLKLMAELGIRSVIRKKRKYSSYKGEEGKIAPNILKREFKAEKPQQKWVTDVTEFRVGNKKLYLSPIMDLYNQEIISYEISERPVFTQVMKMVNKAFRKIPNKTSLILHSDQGWQYQMKKYQKRLEKKGVIQSMSRKGNCLDNSIIENFFGTLKAEMFYLQKFESIEQLKKEIISYINYYNKVRIKSNLKGMSPIEYRAHYFKKIA